MIPVFRFHALSGGIADVVGIRGMSPPKLESGNAKWEVIDRPKRRGATQYVGSDPYRVSVPIIFDWMDDGDRGVWDSLQQMNDQMFALENMKREAGLEPPKVRVTGELPVRGIKDWVVEDTTWGDLVLWRRVGTKELRVRQDVVVHLLERVDVQLVTISSKNPGNSRGQQSPAPKHRSHRVKKGETLGSIAVKEYGDRSKWRAIAKAQRPPVSDPDHLKVGRVLVLP